MMVVIVTDGGQSQLPLMGRHVVMASLSEEIQLAGDNDALHS